MEAALDALAGPKVALPPPDRPSETFLQADLDRAADYRKEYYKYGLTIATALLAFTVSFRPQLAAPPEHTWLVFLGWAGLGIAVASGLRVHMVWAKFFASFQKYDNKRRRDLGEAARGKLTRERRILDVTQLAALLVGVVGVATYTGVNLDKVALKNETKPCEAVGVVGAARAKRPGVGEEVPVPPPVAAGPTGSVEVK